MSDDLEADVLGDRRDDPEAWRRLGAAMLDASFPEDAAECAERAIFLGDVEAASLLREASLQVTSPFVRNARLHAAEVLAGAEQPREEMSAYYPLALRFAVEREVADRTGDAASLLQAKHRAIGALWTRGIHLVPPFVIRRRAPAALEELRQLQGLSLPAGWRHQYGHQVSAAYFARWLTALGGDNAALVEGIRAEEIDPVVRALSHHVARLQLDDDLSLPTEMRRATEFFSRRSRLLGAVSRYDWTAPPTTLPPELLRAIELESADAVAHAIRNHLGAEHDEGLSQRLRSSLVAALKTGNDDVVYAAVTATQERAGAIQIAAHQAEVHLACIDIAGSLDDTDALDEVLAACAAIAASLSPRDVARVVRCAVRAVSQTTSAATAFFNAMHAVVGHGAALAPLSAAFRKVGSLLQARQMLRDVVNAPLPADHLERFQLGMEIIEALDHWDEQTARVLRGTLILRAPQFGDTFTVGRFYPTHQLLIIERVLESACDVGRFFRVSEERWLRGHIRKQVRARAGR